MDKELINVLSDLFDEKLKPIKEEITSISNILCNVKKSLDKLEEKIDSIQEQVNLNAENIEEVKDTVSHIEYTITKNKLEDIKLRNLERRNSKEVDSNAMLQIIKRIEYKINRLDNDVIDIKYKLRKLE